MYASLRSVVPDAEPYARFIAASGEPALELGCGDGDPLLDLRERGLAVEGLDSSADMLARCRAAAETRGVEVVLHHQPIETMDLEKRYRSIFLAGPTFNLLADDDTAGRALQRIHAHLEPGGSALIPLFVPTPTPAVQLGRFREHRAWVLHWHTQVGFRSLADAAGLTTVRVLRPDATPAAPTDTEFVFVLRREPGPKQ